MARSRLLEDACWHRQLPLSMGWLEGETLVCRYHGLGFDGKGQCTRMPSQDNLNPAAKVRSYPALDRYRYVWVWPGDPALADPALVPDMHWNDDPEWAGDGKTLLAKCDYRLFVDNLMDLTHESFVHITSIGSKHVAETPMTTTHSGRTVTSTRWMLDIDAPPFWRAQLGKPGNVDRWQIIHFEAPCTIVLDVGVAPGRHRCAQWRPLAGRQWPRAQFDHAGDRHDLHVFLVDDAQLQTARPVADLAVARSQCQHLPGGSGRGRGPAARSRERPDAPLRNLNIDAGSMRARKIIDDMIASETRIAAE